MKMVFVLIFAVFMLLVVGCANEKSSQVKSITAGGVELSCLANGDSATIKNLNNCQVQIRCVWQSRRAGELTQSVFSVDSVASVKVGRILDRHAFYVNNKEGVLMGFIRARDVLGN